VKPPGPAQLNEAPALADDPSSVTVGEAHVRDLSEPALASGTVLTVTIVVPIPLVQPPTVIVKE
jgi:hypothetical protein